MPEPTNRDPFPTKNRRIRLVDGSRSPIQPATLGEASAPGALGEAKPRVKRKLRKKERKRLEKVLTPESRGGDSAEKHKKKLKAKERLAGDLARLDGALVALDDRVVELQGRQERQAEASAQRALRLESLGEALSELRSVGAGTAEGLGALALRLEGVESALQGPQAGIEELAEFRERLAQGQRASAVQTERVERVERALARIDAEQAPWRADLDQRAVRLDGRIDGLGEELTRLGEQARKRQEVDQCWTDSRLRRLARAQGLGLLVLAVLAATLLAAQWWHNRGALTSVSERLAALESPAPSAVAPVPAAGPAMTLPAPGQTFEPPALAAAIEQLAANLERLEARDGAVSADLLERLRQVESGLAEATRSLAASAGEGDGLAARVADLASGQRLLLDRLDALQGSVGATDTALSLLSGRLDGLSAAAAAPSALPVGSDVPRVQGAMLAEPGYGVQLAAYRGRGRALEFALAQGLGDRALSMEVSAKGRPAHALLLGPYTTESEARAAIEALPDGLRALGPWVRKLPVGTRLEPLR